jgi:hypothetical protein
MCLRVTYKKKYEKKIFFCILKVTERKESDPDPLIRGTDLDPQQNVRDLPHCFLRSLIIPEWKVFVIKIIAKNV